MIRRALFGLLLLVSSAVFAAERPTPIAVMPFKNLNSDPALTWLTVGMAETMLADLKRVAKLPVVERDQIDKAMSEIALQNAKGSDEATAARVGKLVGAKTIVIGGIQQAGTQLRITARFVNVETGEVLDTAKATGAMDNVFQLQDEIVAKLIGQPVAKARPVARKSTPQKTVRAYKLYASALTTASDAEKMIYLKKAVEEDPEFSYAIEDLAELERRMERYGKASLEQKTERVEVLKARIKDPTATDEARARDYMQLFQILMASQKFREIRETVDDLDKIDLKPTDWGNPKEIGEYYAFMAAGRLNDDDDALRRGEKMLKLYPTGAYYEAVDIQMRQIIDKRRAAVDDAKEYAKKLQEEDDDLRKDEEEQRKRGRELLSIRYMNRDARKCLNAMSYHQYPAALEACPKFVADWKDKSPDQFEENRQMYLFLCEYNTGQALYNLGRGLEARKKIEALIVADPERSRQYGLRNYLMMLPRD